MDYPAIKWSGNFSYSGAGATNVYPTNSSYASNVKMIRGSGDIIYVKNTGGGNQLDTGGRRTILSPYNRNTGYRLDRVLTTATSSPPYWLRLLSAGVTGPDLTLSQNGTLYTEDMSNDTLSAYNSSDGSIKWIYAFGAGHDNQDVNIGDDGTVYTIRRISDNTQNTIYAFNPDGTVKWTASPTGTSIPTSSQNVAIGTNGNIYFGNSTLSGVNYTNQGALYAINPSNGTTTWNYPTGDVGHTRPVVDTDGTVYVANSEATSTLKSIFAINSEGTIKWSYNIGTSTSYWINLSLRSDGILLADRVTGAYPAIGGQIDAINTSDGSLLWSLPLNSQNHTWSSQVFSDSANNFVVRTTIYQAATALSQYDSSHNLKWTLSRNNGHYAFFGDSMQDEDGNIYTAYIDATANTTKIFALIPWTLSIPNAQSYCPGDSVVFSVTTSMQRTNILTGDDNKVQVIVSGTTTIPLSYSSTNSNGDTVWTGSYVPSLPMDPGIYSFVVEASQAEVQTDTLVNFSSFPQGSNNTGIALARSFSVASSGCGTLTSSSAPFLLPSSSNVSQTNPSGPSLMKINDTAPTPVTSPITPTTTTYNFGTTILKNGSKGEAVMELQRFLNAKLNLGLAVDGKLGPKTIAVIKKWQKDNGLIHDGLVGPKTKAKMNALAL